MTLSKKQIIWTSAIAILGVALGYTAVWLNKQIKKIQDYTLTFKTIKINSFTQKVLDFNVFYDYKNNSDIDINLNEQEYDVYINGIFVTTLKNYAENTLKANTTSPLGFNVQLNLPEIHKKIKMNYFAMITMPENVKIRVVMRWKVRLGLIKVPVKYNWDITLKSILGWYLPIYKN